MGWCMCEVLGPYAGGRGHTCRSWSIVLCEVLGMAQATIRDFTQIMKGDVVLQVEPFVPMDVRKALLRCMGLADVF